MPVFVFSFWLSRFSAMIDGQHGNASLVGFMFRVVCSSALTVSS
jgi:hypothetical protein